MLNHVEILLAVVTVAIGVAIGAFLVSTMEHPPSTRRVRIDTDAPLTVEDIAAVWILLERHLGTDEAAVIVAELMRRHGLTPDDLTDLEAS